MKKNSRSVLIIFLCLAVPILIMSGCSSHKKPIQQPQQKSVPQDSPLETKVEQPAEEIELPAEQIQEKKEPESKPAEEQKAPIEQADPAQILDEALDSYQDAQRSWERGDLDTALLTLDQALLLILNINLPPESELNEDKYNLRLLIARRIQEIHASRRTAIGNNHNSIPLDENKHVQAEIKSFQNRERRDFEAAYIRSGLYREMILEELNKEGLPAELAWMPMIESWFKVNAYSTARALGLWQFISSTGTRFGLKRDTWIDERMDFIKASRAAAKYLDELHSLFGDWTTALAAYNCGEFRVQRVINAQRLNYLDNFWDIYAMLPKETARFVPRFIATLLIINSPEKYGFDLPDPAPSLRFETVNVRRPVNLSSLAKALGLETEDLTALNPELRHKSTPENEYEFRVPVGYGEKTLASITDVQRYIPAEATTDIHLVRRGETVSGIAQRYRTSISVIARLNGLSRNYLIRPGQRLKVPSRGGGSTTSAPRELIQEGEKLVYIVKRGDTLYTLAKFFNTTVNRIKRDNSLSSDLLKIGQKLSIQSSRPDNAIQYTVKSGDIPVNIARRYGMSLDVFLSINGLSRQSTIYPGQKLWVIPNSPDGNSPLVEFISF
jgi:membrane-bound lytic murein transglycosylase D